MYAPTPNDVIHHASHTAALYDQPPLSCLHIHVHVPVRDLGWE